MSALPPPASFAPAVESLYLAHHGWLQMWLRKKLSSAADAADIAHDTFLRVLASRARSQSRIAEPRAFLTTIAKGLVIDQWRRQELERAYKEALALQPDLADAHQNAALLYAQLGDKQLAIRHFSAFRRIERS